ncbi:hypothetical protein [Streptomyces sp. NPDC127114]|uniref:hypothetical protein n=1 Tax=Streptomyces sp. NPDC127114 TaxID=3345366 RepID=UPI00363DC519
MSLSHAECHALAPLVEEWFARDAEESDVVRALTTGLPAPVHHPAALARRRLTDKLPPEPIRRDRIPRRMLECAECCAPDYTDALVDGHCAPCRGEPPAPARRALLPAALVRARATAIRQELERTRT